MSGRRQMAKAQFGEPVTKPRRASWLEERVARWLGESGLPQPMREFRFAPPRLFRFDFAWVDRGLFVEMQGGIWIHGAHSRGVGFADDCEKFNLATMLGWRGLKFTERQVRDGSAFERIREALTTEIRYVPSLLTETRD